MDWITLRGYGLIRTYIIAYPPIQKRLDNLDLKTLERTLICFSALVKLRNKSAIENSQENWNRKRDCYAIPFSLLFFNFTVFVSFKFELVFEQI